MQSQLHLAHEEIKRLVKAEERERIARDLHDTLGHTLSAISLKGELAEKFIPNDASRAMQEIQDIRQTARTTLQQVRTLVSGMYASDLKKELEQGEQLLASAGMTSTVTGPFTEIALSPFIEHVLSMCLREALTNVARHSQATYVIVQLEHNDGHVILSVMDNGIGIHRREGHGISGMREVLELVGGRLSIANQVQGGALICMTVPQTMLHIDTHSKEEHRL